MQGDVRSYLMLWPEIFVVAAQIALVAQSSRGRTKWVMVSQLLPAFTLFFLSPTFPSSVSAHSCACFHSRQCLSSDYNRSFSTKAESGGKVVTWQRRLIVHHQSLQSTLPPITAFSYIFFSHSFLPLRSKENLVCRHGAALLDQSVLYVMCLRHVPGKRRLL